jgi:dephospho-CoA kinase
MPGFGNKRKTMLHIGVTGGIGSGKSAFLKEWDRLGVPVVYADDLARELMVSDLDLKSAIIREFGNRSYNSDGTLNRQYLAEAAFGAGRVEELNRIVHPAVFRELENKKNNALADGAQLFAHESALLFASGNTHKCDIVVLISCPVEERIRRVAARDGSDRDSVRKRIAKQPDFDLLEKKADYVVSNDGPPEVLERKAKALYRELLAIAAKSVGR